MALKRKIFFVSLAATILLGACVAGVILYLYHHPSRIKPLVEQAVSSSTGAFCVIDDLSYAFEPMRVEARGITLRPGENQSGFLVKVPAFRAEIALTGRFGSKSLSLKALRISGFSVRLSSDMILPKTGQKDAAPSFIGRLAKRIISFLLFKEITFETAEADNGTLEFKTADQSVHVEGIQAGLRAGEPVRITCSARGSWSEKKISFAAPRILIETDHAVSLVSPAIKGVMKVEEAVFQSPYLDVGTMAMEAACRYDFDRKTFDFHPVDIRLAGMQFKQDIDRDMLPEDFRLTVDGSFDLNENRLDVPKFSFSGGEALGLTGSVKGALKSGGSMELKGLFTAAPLENLQVSAGILEKKPYIRIQGQDTGLIELLAAANRLPRGWMLNGLEAVDVKASLNEHGAWTVTGQLDLKAVGFEGPDSLYMGEGIVAGAGMSADVDLKNSRVTARASLKVHGGELLWDRLYVDLGKNGFDGFCEGSYDIAGKSVKFSQVKVDMKDVFTVRGGGTIVHAGKLQRADLSLSLKETPLMPLYRIFLVEPFQRENPLLASLTVDGAVAAVLNFKGTPVDWTARGHCRWADGAVSSDDHGLFFRGIDLDFPFWLQSASKASDQKPAKGGLTVQVMRVPMLPEQAFRASLEASPNHLFVRPLSSLQLPGGELRIGPVTCRNIQSPDRSVETSLTLDGVQVKPLLSDVWTQPIEGTIDGGLTPILFKGDRILTEGQINVHMADGRIVVSDLAVSGMFSPGPVLELSAQWRDLSLHELTSGTAFGKVEGVLQGHLRGLEIAYGQPQAFDLLLETVKRDGVPQRISVKAVDNISQIGGGQSPFIGVAGILASVFDDFPYTKIGIRASLKNDVFRINGTIMEGGTEYLVKRGSISGVNVVNQNPDNRVRFKDMVNRIKRVTAGKSPPVIQ